MRILRYLVTLSLVTGVLPASGQGRIIGCPAINDGGVNADAGAWHVWVSLGRKLDHMTYITKESGGTLFCYYEKRGAADVIELSRKVPSDCSVTVVQGYEATIFRSEFGQDCDPIAGSIYDSVTSCALICKSNEPDK
jgi:hypothetical protein